MWDTNSAHQGDDNYLVSVSDLMIGLLFVFIIMLMAFALNYRQAENLSQTEADKQRLEQQRLIEQTEALRRERLRLENEKQRLEHAVERLTDNQVVRRDLLREIQETLSQHGLRVLIDEEQGILRLPEALLFASGEARFSPAGRQAVQQLAVVLGLILPCYSQAEAEVHAEVCPDGRIDPRLEAVLIEGHTDDRPIRTSEFRDNWQLASARALHTFQTLSAHVPLLDELKNTQGHALLSVSAYAERRPVAPHGSEEGRRHNRRIDLRFLMAAPSPEMVDAVENRMLRGY